MFAEDLSQEKGNMSQHAGKAVLEGEEQACTLPVGMAHAVRKSFLPPGGPRSGTSWRQ